MLVLSRKANESIVFPELGITVEVIRTSGNRVRLGITAPNHLRVLRGELIEGSNCPPIESTEQASLELSVA